MRWRMRYAYHMLQQCTCRLYTGHTGSIALKSGFKRVLIQRSPFVKSKDIIKAHRGVRTKIVCGRLKPKELSTSRTECKKFQHADTLEER